MLTNVTKMTEKELEPLVKEALSTNKSGPEFVSKYLSNMSDILKVKPSTYRSYGMYWWAMKELLVSHGHSEFGSELELGTLQAYRYDDPVLTCCAAWAYHSDNVENGNLYSSDHIALLQDGDFDAYSLHDLEMEALVIG